mmetsp:Transcript_15117/g.32788  ORF Transcript_15117/g.32788 Transcript_15117/m.32788 type:complete len:312 (+) Transcript_15117:167-1102(+)|eukprot:CAMPEP_0202901524 /NCGR_PEP_ID=MMETSP1392-20130828/14304_1 /ASSEMBLY_ACC=CAM_ASM_000868 /TAXON_ID=225041 /ORGANISM="Chlamydomonas chlamydogama, Strain SAG 11-48b" /LENGTH=311 /DNA_ID=CAMNT_0049588097 /DNA_START=160 /DNA_END=1095 /DNA_ORIENTATION=-
MSADDIQQLKADLWDKLGDEKASLVNDDETLKRFLKATGGNYQLTLKRLQKTAAWRADRKPEEVDCPACAADCTSHYMHLCGYDKQGRPVLYSTFALMGKRTVHLTMDHMIQMFEMAVRSMPPGVEQWVWLNDFVGFGVSDLNPSLALSFLELSADHYPERLGQLLVLDAPGILTPLWNMLKPFIDPVTHKKIRFLPHDLPRPGGGQHDSQLLRALNELMDEELVQWVLQEMKTVRGFTSGEGPRPMYDMRQLRSAVESGKVDSLYPALAPGQQGSSTAATGQLGHCHYGTTKMLDSFLAKPNIVIPEQKT